MVPRKHHLQQALRTVCQPNSTHLWHLNMVIHVLCIPIVFQILHSGFQFIYVFLKFMAGLVQFFQARATQQLESLLVLPTFVKESEFGPQILWEGVLWGPDTKSGFFFFCLFFLSFFCLFFSSATFWLKFSVKVRQKP